MPDITMCSNDDCVKKCYRRLATPSEYRQSYGCWKVIKNKCSGFMACKVTIKLPKNWGKIKLNNKLVDF